MNSRLLLTVASLAGLTLSCCNKPEPEAPAAPANTQSARPVEAPTPVTPPAPSGPTESERKLAQQLREAQTRQLELELKLEEEKLARADAEIAQEQQLLNEERGAWWQAQEPYIAPTTPASYTSLPVSLDYDERAYGCDYQMFYDDLAPYGTWYNSADYGYVWCPTICVTDTSWRPYTIGSWVNCDQGWAWCSAEPFGWACYHYGRWAQIRGCGWVWVPGDQWAPCWVSWRRNDDYIGWCPLPPETVYDRDCIYGPTVDRDCGINPGCYVFMRAKHFDRPCRNYCEAPVTCLKIFASTANITNLVVRPGRVECHGPKVDWIKDSVRRPLPLYTLARETKPAGRGQRAHRMEKDTMRYYAPKVQAPWNSQLRPARHTTLASQEVVRADGGLPDKLATRFRTERKEREKAVETLKGGARAVVERQNRLASLEQTRNALREQIARQQAIARTATPDSSTAASERPDRAGKPSGRASVARAVPVPESPQSSASVPSNANAAATAREDLVSRREGAARQREDQAAAAGQQRREADAASRREVVRNDNDQQDKQSALRAQIEEKRRQQNEAASAIAQQAAIEQQRRAVEAASRADVAATRETEKQAALRAQIEEKRRQQQEAQNEQASTRAALEQQRRASGTAVRAETARNETASRELDRQSAIRAAQEQQSRQAGAAAEAEARAEQQARQREAMEQQRAASEQQRRQADAEARAEQQRREAAEMQRRQQEAETRQRQVQEEQRRNAEEQQQRRQESETRQQRVQEEQRRNAEEQQQRRQADENAKNAAEQQRRQENDRNREEKGKR